MMVASAPPAVTDDGSSGLGGTVEKVLRSGSSVGLFAIVATVCAGGAWLGFVLPTVTGLPDMLFIPAGACLAFLLLAGRSGRGVVAVAAGLSQVAVALLADRPPLVAGALGVGLVAEGLVGAALLERVDRFDLVDDAGPFLGAAAVAAGVGALLVGPAVALSGGPPLPDALVQTWMSRGLGIVLVGGLLLAGARTANRGHLRSRLGLGLLFLSLSLSFATFYLSDLPLVFLVGSAVVVAGTRFGPRAVLVDSLAVATGAALGLVADPGVVFIGMSPETGMILLRLKIGVFVVAGLSSASLARDREVALAGAVDARLRQAEEAQAREDADFLTSLTVGLESLPTFAERARRFATLAEQRFRGPAAVVVADEDGAVSLFPSPTWGSGVGEGDAVRRLPLPLGDLRGELVFRPGDPDGWAAERRFAVEVVERAGRLLERARVQELERRIALRLQRGLLAPRPARIYGASVAVRYEAGDDLMEVGGDWYDVFELPGGLVGLAVGDVVGHGVEAAATMGRLRTALTALAPHADGPATLLSWLDRYSIRDTEGPPFATVCFAVLDPRRGLLRYASAGHPPMLLVTPAGNATWLDGGRSRPLCGDPDPDRFDAAAPLEPGDTLILYSDGLVESRSRALTEGLEALRTVARAGRREPVEELSSHLLREMGVDESRDDDVVVVCARFLPSGATTFHRYYPAAPETVARIGEEVRRWARSCPTVAANGERLAVAVEEAVGGLAREGGPAEELELTVILDPDGARVAVRDFGSRPEALPRTEPGWTVAPLGDGTRVSFLVPF